jgi:hypothetical protein
LFLNIFPPFSFSSSSLLICLFCLICSCILMTINISVHFSRPRPAAGASGQCTRAWHLAWPVPHNSQGADDDGGF